MSQKKFEHEPAHGQSNELPSLSLLSGSLGDTSNAEENQQIWMAIKGKGWDKARVVMCGYSECLSVLCSK